MRIGIVGIGFMGSTHYVAAKSLAGVKVAAIATRDARKLSGDWRAIGGNLGSGGGRHDLSGVRCYTDWKALISDPQVDLVDICTPTPLHHPVALAALAAGKDVLVEKPIALSSKAGAELLAAAEAAGRRLFVAQVLPFFPEHAYLRGLIEEGAHGQVVAARFKRIVGAHSYPEGWAAYIDKTGGTIRDLNVHDADFIHKALGLPDWVQAAGPKLPNGQPPWVSIQYGYNERPLVVTVECGAVTMPGRDWQHGFDVFFEQATVQYDSAFGQPLELLTPDDAITKPEFAQDDAFTNELAYVRDAVDNNGPDTWLSGRAGLRALQLCEAAEQSLREGRRVPIGA